MARRFTLCPRCGHTLPFSGICDSTRCAARRAQDRGVQAMKDRLNPAAPDPLVDDPLLGDDHRDRYWQELT